LHDTAFFEKAGIPAIALISSGFKPQAQYQAKSLGLEGAARIFIQHPIQDQTTEELCQKADNVFKHVVERLLTSDDWTEVTLSETAAPGCNT